MTTATIYALRRVLVVLLAAGATACGTLQLPVKHVAEESLVEYAVQLARLESGERHGALGEALARWEKSRDPRDRARVGLARGQWGHEGHDPMAAAEDIRAALDSESASWRQPERAFLELRAAQLSYLAAREGEIKRTRENLDEAQRKLRAITDIERALGQDNGEE